MRQLHLIRHAKSSWDYPELSDHDRPLNKRGKSDVPVMTQRLLVSGIQIDMVKSSTAIRAEQYAQALASAFAVPLQCERELYTFDDQQLLWQIRQLDNDCQNIAVVGHNPAMTLLSGYLSNTDINNLPTSGAVSLACDIEDWHAITPQACQLIQMDYPKRGAR